MSNETTNANEVNQNNEVLENSQQEGAVMEDNAKYYPEQPVSTQEKNTNILYGIVTNCKQLNVRREAQKRADNVLCVISAGDVLEIHKDRSTNAWFYVTTADSIAGYCMKEFVAVEQ